MIFGIVGIISLVANFVDISFFINVVNSLERYVYVLVPAISIILLMASYLISNKIYINKEF